jgi:hypothetical protein
VQSNGNTQAAETRLGAHRHLGRAIIQPEEAGAHLVGAQKVNGSSSQCATPQRKTASGKLRKETHCKLSF